MSTMIYVDQENGLLGTPAPPKNRARLLSAPGRGANKWLKTPLSGKGLCAAPGGLSARKALGAVNKIRSTEKGKPVVTPLPREKTKACKPQVKEEVYPEIERFIPYNPLDFESFEVPEEQRLSHLCLAGLAVPTLVPEEEESLDMLDVCLQLSPVKMPKEDFSAELDSFLQTVSELTVDLPPVDCED
ncbi:securin [Amia ocellicauda]|uniref:securin n=1 Tax=Amia ocellicauda TaxID=2972642 RepID=UPI003464AA82